MNELVIRPPVLRLSVLIIRTEIRTWPRSKEWMSGKMTELIKMSGVYSIESLYVRVSTVRGRPVIQGQRSYRINSCQWIYFSWNNCLCHVVNCFIYRLGSVIFSKELFLWYFDIRLNLNSFVENCGNFTRDIFWTILSEIDFLAKFWNEVGILNSPVPIVPSGDIWCLNGY